MVAEGAFTALTNAFFIALAALIPGGSLGWVALIVGASSLWHALGTGWRMVMAGGGVLMLARRLFYVAANVVVYSLECFYASQMLGLFRPPQPEAVYSIAYVLLAVVAIGLSRAWQLLGAPRRGFLAWLSPLQPEQTTRTKTEIQPASVSHEPQSDKATSRTEPPAR